MNSTSPKTQSETKTPPTVIGIIVDVSNSMCKNWRNHDGRPLPRIEVVRDTLNERLRKVNKDNASSKRGRNVDVFCLGMGFKVPMHLSDVELSFGTETTIPNTSQTRTYVDLVCDLLALVEILPTEAQLHDFKMRLDTKWRSLTRYIFDQATISEDVYTELIDYLKSSLQESAIQSLRRDPRYKAFVWLDFNIKTIERFSILDRLHKRLFRYINQRQRRIEDESDCLAPKYFGSIISSVTNEFTKNRNIYIDIVEGSMSNFV